MPEPITVDTLLSQVERISCLPMYQLYASLVFFGKDIENRDRRTHKRETIVIYATATRKGSGDSLLLLKARGWVMPDDATIVHGALLGTVEIVDCTDNTVTVESQRYARRVNILREIDVPFRFVSVGPMLSSVELDLTGINFVVCEGESGSHLLNSVMAEKRSLVHKVGKAWLPRPDRLQWVLNLRDQCAAAGVPFWFKQFGGPYPSSAGSLLEGRAHNEFPTFPDDKEPPRELIPSEALCRL